MNYIYKKLLDILVCPLDKAPLKESPDIPMLTCTKCGREYQIKNGIPIMLIDDEIELKNQ